MIRNPLALRLDPGRPIRDQIREAARLGARGIVVDAIGDLAPHRLSETGRRELRHLLRSVEVSLAALSLPTRRPFDTNDQLDDRLRRAEAAFTMAHELGTQIVLARVGGIPPESEEGPREVFTGALAELGRRADHRGVRLAIETGPVSGEDLRALLDRLASPGLAASIDPPALLQRGHDPCLATRSLGAWVAHAYLGDASTSTTAPGLSPYRRTGFPAGVLDWAEFLGSLEEASYWGPLTVAPDPGPNAAAAFQRVVERLRNL